VRDGSRRAGLPPLVGARAAQRADLRRRLGEPRHRRRRPALLGLQLAAGLHKPGSPAPTHRRGCQGASRPAVHPFPRPCLGRPRRSSAADRRGRPGGTGARAVHHRRYRGHRARGTDGAPAQRAAQGARRLPARTTARRRPQFTSPATRAAGRRTPARRVPSTSSAPSCTARRSGRARPRRSASAHSPISSR
jgi:hypothetical protein